MNVLKAVWWGMAVLVSPMLWATDVPTVAYSELVFHSAFEQAQFELLNNGKPNALGLLLAVDSTNNAQSLTEVENTFNTFATAVPVDKLSKKGDDKVVKYVFESGHVQYLKTYELLNYFSNIFSNGQYNCVSASAFYYTVLTKLGIPAQIHETPNHVYVVAYPQTLKILLETTDPLLGFQPLSSKYAKSYISIMQAVKLVSEEELAGYGTDEAFEKLFFADKEVSLLGLAGIQYLNSGIYHYEAKNYMKAYYEFKKGLFIYPDARSQAMMLLSIAYAFETDGFNTGNIHLFADYIKYGAVRDAAEEMIGDFGAASYSVVVKGGEQAEIDSMYHNLSAALTDSAAQSGLDYVYHYNLAVDYTKKGGYKQSQEHIAIAYKIRPLNEDVRSVIAQNLSMKHYGTSNLELLASDMEESLATYPFLTENHLFTGQLNMAYLANAGSNFELGAISKALAYLAKFEAAYHPDMVIDSELIGMCYGSAAAYYFKQGSTGKARAFVKKGLEYAPGNYELQRRLKALD